ncbi:helix-turn-helix domain-containing protein [Cellvibrio sp. QJXJ]|uniref:helix-turn-helix domain-containing protein n=1 Tax=Cellvibrio sp. QJXJ TaxID=2964606 RepID=UPI0021C37BCD|nr:helix-turn-helix transcriptional regulator [Cellvibrio sp. QJXJ]UUA75171.1 helix-turn-helix domain-containing protein [Cellvibrio sp. QJXJ]
MTEKKRSQARVPLSNPTIAKSFDFGVRLRAARKRRGWSLDYAQELTGISKTTIKRIEKGDPSVAWGFFLVVLQVYGLISELDSLCQVSKDYLAPVPLHSRSNSTATFDDDLS